MHFTRRGGLDINPYRGTEPLDPDSLSLRTARQ
jgi:NADPH-dependent 7-cyano-7-deazaguanine reductase QueF